MPEKSKMLYVKSVMGTTKWLMSMLKFALVICIYNYIEDITKPHKDTNKFFVP